jgi:hypothetical protein
LDRALVIRLVGNPPNRLSFADTQSALSGIPHSLSFSTPEYGRPLCSVEAKLGLSFL